MKPSLRLLPALGLLALRRPLRTASCRLADGSAAAAAVQSPGAHGSGAAGTHNQTVTERSNIRGH